MCITLQYTDCTRLESRVSAVPVRSGRVARCTLRAVAITAVHVDFGTGATLTARRATVIPHSYVERRLAGL